MMEVYGGAKKMTSIYITFWIPFLKLKILQKVLMKMILEKNELIQSAVVRQIEIIEKATNQLN
jgi:hypothetical protein